MNVVADTFMSNQCYDADPSIPTSVCNKTAKTCAWENLTYLDHSDHGTPRFADHYIFSGRTTHSISPHIHGLDVRPLFDGNPTAWFGNDGSRGIGF